MSTLSDVWNTVQTSSSVYALYRWLTGGLAIVVFVVSLAINILFWPVPYLGFNSDPLTAIIAFIEPGSPAAASGLQVGDHVILMYGHSLDEVLSQTNVLSLVGPQSQPVPITVERASTLHTFMLVQGSPSTTFQIAKVTNGILALLCWLTGYFFGIIRRHEPMGTWSVAWFWFAASGVLGTYLFAWFASYPLRLVLQWLILAILIPLAVYIHVWFPVRAVSAEQARTARRTLIGSWVLMNAGLAASLIIWRPSLIQFVSFLSDMLLVASLVGVVFIGIILQRAYRQTTIERVHRPIRLIAMACWSVAGLWLLLIVLPSFLEGDALIADHWIDLLAAPIPLAYLAGRVKSDLYRLDRLALRIGVHLGTIIVLIGVLTVITTTLVLQQPPSPLWIALYFVVFYRPVERFGLRLLPATMNAARTYQPLHEAATKLTATLDVAVLVDIICDGVQATFGQPAHAFYLGHGGGDLNDLTQVRQERLPCLPTIIPTGTLTETLGHMPPVVESKGLHTALAQVSLNTTEEQALRDPDVVLWCPIHDSNRHLLGVLLLSMRSDLDPYRAQDIRELQRLLEAAALALTNSAAYMQQREDKQMIRHLYQRLQQERDTTAAAIARELHDEVININVRLNIESLQKLIQQSSDPLVRKELEELLESEHTVAETLRMACKRLYPTATDDPLGLASLLRMQAERILVAWPGVFRVDIEGEPTLIAAATQREIVFIATEALINAFKHADATEIVVQLCYPTTAAGMARLTIRDNGSSGQTVTLKPDHCGVRGMIDRAAVVGGTLRFRRASGGGTIVEVQFPVIQINPLPDTHMGEKSNHAAV